jgi:hypothetical protein
VIITCTEFSSSNTILVHGRKFNPEIRNSARKSWKTKEISDYQYLGSIELA